MLEHTIRSLVFFPRWLGLRGCGQKEMKGVCNTCKKARNVYHILDFSRMLDRDYKDNLRKKHILFHLN